MEKRNISRGRAKAIKVSGVRLFRKLSLLVLGLIGCWADGKYLEATSVRKDCDDSGNWVYIDCMYEPARVGIFERIEEATLNEVCDLLRSKCKYLLYVANIFFDVELTEQCIKRVLPSFLIKSLHIYITNLRTPFFVAQ